MTSLAISKIKESLLSNISSLKQFNINSSVVATNDNVVIDDNFKVNSNNSLIIPSSLRKQTEMLDKIANSKTFNNSYTLEIKPLSMRSKEEKRFISLLSHFIKKSETNNQAIYKNLNIKYKDDASRGWNKALVNEQGCTLSGKNPHNFYRFIASIHKAAHGNNHPEQNYNNGQRKWFIPMSSMKIKDEASELYLSLNIPDVADIQPDISDENLLDILELINIQAELLKIKENSIKLRQDNLISLYNGNPNTTVREMILGTNTMNLELRKEQTKLVSLCDYIGDVLKISPVTGADTQLNKALSTTSSFKLMNDNDLKFIITTDELDNKQLEADAYEAPTPYKSS